MVNYWLKFKQKSIFSTACILCNTPLRGKRLALCSGCHKDLPWLPQGCRHCASPLIGERLASKICGHCQSNPPPYHHCVCLFNYRHPVDKLITQLKFNEQLAYGPLLGQLMAEHLVARLATEEIPQAVIPVPLHHARLRQRGFNQAVEIARLCAKTLAIPLLHSHCRRIKDTPHQLGLDAKTRRSNLRSAFRLSKPINYRSVAIVDDVLTTGTTASALSLELLRAGVQQIHLWCIAKTTIE